MQKFMLKGIPRPRIRVPYPKLNPRDTDTGIQDLEDIGPKTALKVFAYHNKAHTHKH